MKLSAPPRPEQETRALERARAATSLVGRAVTWARARLRRPPGRRTAIAALAALLLVAVLGYAAVDTLARLRDARRSLLAARADLLSVQDTLRPLINFDPNGWPDAEQFMHARAQTAAARAGLAAARTRLGPLLRVAPHLGWLPVIGEDVAEAPAVLDVGDEVTAGAEQVLGTAEPLFAGDGTVIQLAREVFVERGDALQAGLARLDAARPEVARLAAIDWRGPFSPAVGMLSLLAGDLERVPEARGLTQDLGASFDALLGFDRPVTYVLLGQNDHEIRPTGGFIGTMGLVTLQNGAVTASDYRSSYDFDPTPLPDRPPPEPMIRFLGSSVWLLREANWWPHFPATGEQVLQFMHEDQGTTADGVVAVDSEMVALLLGVFGPITVDEFDQPLTTDNWFLEVEDALYQAQIGHDQAKEAYLTPVVKELLARAQAATRAEVPALMRALQQGVAGRHLQVYARAAAVEQLVDRFGASGAMRPVPGADFVAVIDSNFSYDKIQPAIHRDITYLRHADGVVDLLITWRNEVSTYDGARYARFGTTGGIYDYQNGRLQPDPGVFGNFTRIYLLPGAELLAARGFDSAPRYEQEHGLTVISGFLAIPDGAERSVRISYHVAGGDAASGVLVWKQGGFTPGGATVMRNATLPGTDGTTQVEEYRGALSADRFVRFAGSP